MDQFELIIGYLIAWGMTKLRRVGSRLDDEVDGVIEANLDRLHEAVTGRLGSDPAVTDLLDEVADSGVASELTRRRAELAVEAAYAKDSDFAARLETIVRDINPEGRKGGTTSATGPTATAVGGDVRLHAEGGSVAAFSMGEVNVGQAPTGPPLPGR